MLKKNLFIALTGIVGAAAVLTSCGDERSPGWEYMPDMYESRAVETYSANAMFKDSLSALEPVEGTVARGFMSYETFPNTTAGYDSAKTAMLMPSSISTDEATMEEAKVLYGIFCSQCHGAKGDGQGILVKNDKFAGIPNYADRDITLGSIFHVVTYGKGAMGSHASQVTPDERWKIAQYVMALRAELKGETAEPEAAEGDATEEAATEATAEAPAEEENENNQG